MQQEREPLPKPPLGARIFGMSLFVVPVTAVVIATVASFFPLDALVLGLAILRALGLR